MGTDQADLKLFLTTQNFSKIYHYIDRGAKKNLES